MTSVFSSIITPINNRSFVIIISSVPSGLRVTATIGLHVTQTEITYTCEAVSGKLTTEQEEHSEWSVIAEVTDLEVVMRLRIYCDASPEVWIETFINCDRAIEL
jgi:hypothetical protein